MTKKLSELFELPEDDDTFKPDTSLAEQVEEVTDEALSTLDKIEAALPQVRGLDASDRELDDISEMAVNSYKDLMDLAMQVDSRFSAELATSAGTMLGHALSARTAKINKKLKTIDLQLKKLAMEQKINASVEKIEATPLGDFKSLDRNELLRMLSKKDD